MSLQRIKHLVPVVVLLGSLFGFMPESGTAATPGKPAHDSTHPLVMQQAGAAVAAASVGSLQPFAPAPKLAAVGGPGGTQREVFGFALASTLSDPTVGYSTWNFSLLTTVAFFGLHIQADGSIAADSGLSVWNSSQLTGLLTTAHAHGTKVVLTIILQDFSSGTPMMCSALAHFGTTVASAVAEVKAKGVDGLNVDYEGLNGSCGTTDPSSARNTFTAFVASLHASLPAGLYLSVDSYASSAADPVGFFDIPRLSPSIDSFFVMAYDLEYSNYWHAPPGCTSFCLGPTAPLAGYYYNDTDTAAQYAATVPASKVILGVPYYGRKACVGPGVADSYPTSAVVADSYLDATGEATYYLTSPGSFSAHRDPHDSVGQERWDTWLNTQLNCTRELYWDDTVSLAQKYALVNRDNLRGVGLWNLNYGGGAAELWGTLSTYFACPVAVNIAASQTTTTFSIPLSAGSCSVAYFDIQLFDSTLNQGWYSLTSVGATNGSGTGVADTYPGHTYQIRARAHSTGGVVSDWGTGTTQVGATATKGHAWGGLYVLDAFGGLANEDSQQLAFSAYWPGWRIARAAHSLPGNGQSGAVLDGYGGLHAYGAMVNLQWSAYWSGWDIARDFAFLPNGTSGYVLDGWGGLHGFSVNGAAMPPAPQGTTYWRGWDIARKIVIFADGTGGYVLDGFGGIHGFGIGQAAPANPKWTGYWPGWDIAHDFALIPGTRSGYVMDGYGGLHGFAPAGQPLPPGFAGAPYWSGWDIARGVWMLPTATVAQPAGYLLDGYGGLHPLGSTPPIVSGPYWRGSDVARTVFGA